MKTDLRVGSAAPLGATVQDGGANFSLFSRTAVGMEMLLFDRVDDAKPSRVIPLDPAFEPDVSLLAPLRAGHASRASSTLTARAGRSTRRPECDSIRRKSCSIRMAAVSRSRQITIARPRAAKATTPHRP